MFTKVTVTPTTVIAQQAVILTNYNRPDPHSYELPYRLVLTYAGSHNARATSAAPPSFKQFIKKDTQSAYVDGALYHNNPVWVTHHERRMIWGDVASAPPDILLSIGTGANTAGQEKTRPVRNQPPFENGEASSPQVKGKSSSTPWKMWWNIATDRFDRLLQCDDIWRTFMAENIFPEFDGNGNHRRYIRINPDLQTREVAHRLIASTFFFEKAAGSVKQQDSSFTCEGRIHCRFEQNSDEMKDLGEFLRSYIRGTFEPFLFVEERGLRSNSFTLRLSEHIINDLYLRGTFNLPRIQISTSKESSSTMISLCLQTTPYPFSTDSHLPISGFPRELMTEDSRARVLTAPPTPQAHHPGTD
ncbi:hypothetical protein OQA88_5669 [Cercophora sp. LCS_1]